MKTIANLLLVLLLSTSISYSQKKQKSDKKQKSTSLTFNNLKWRNIGPFRGGRSVTSSGVYNAPSTFYMGTTGGGVWKTKDNGINWKNI